jgi:hypothetical protein
MLGTFLTFLTFLTFPLRFVIWRARECCGGA